MAQSKSLIRRGDMPSSAVQRRPAPSRSVQRPSGAGQTHQITWTDAGRIANYCPSGRRTDIECTVCFVRFCMVRYGQIWSDLVIWSDLILAVRRPSGGRPDLAVRRRTDSSKNLDGRRTAAGRIWTALDGAGRRWTALDG